MSEEVKAKDVFPKCLGAGVKGNRITGTVGRYLEVAFVTLSKKDPHFSGKTKLINLFNQALTQADKLNLPLAGVATALRDLVEGKGFIESQVGKFFMAYGHFEGKFGTSGAGTCQAMRRLATKNDYLEYVSKSGEKFQHPAPYVIRNWLAHLGSSSNSYSEEAFTHAYGLLTKWTQESS